MTRQTRRRSPIAAAVVAALAVTVLGAGMTLPARADATPARRVVVAATCNPLQRLLNQCPASDPEFPPVATVAVPPTTPTCGGEQPLKADGTPWQCTFDDEFDASTGDAHALDTNRWLVQETSNSGFTMGTGTEKACFLASGNNVSVSDGTLRLSANTEPQPFRCHSSAKLGGLLPGLMDFSTVYDAGEVISRYSQTYGRFTVRAKLPPSVAQGLQETFWLWPVDYTYGTKWPASGEIDFAEFYSYLNASPTGPEVTPYIHYNTASTSDSLDDTTNLVNNPDLQHRCNIDLDRFHTYTVEWTPQLISIYYDDTLCFADNWQPSNVAHPAPFDQPFMLALTQAIGQDMGQYDDNSPDADTPTTATTLIDYVRVWQ